MGLSKKPLYPSFTQLDEENTHKLPELNLIAEVISRALRDFLNNDTVDLYQQEIRSAQKWIMSKSHKPYSFIWCCEHLSLNPVTVKKIALNWRATGFKFNV